MQITYKKTYNKQKKTAKKIPKKIIKYRNLSLLKIFFANLYYFNIQSF